MPPPLSQHPLQDGMAGDLRIIGHVSSPFGEKFGTPRQPGLVPSASGELHLLPPYGCPDAVRGLEGFSHLWIIFWAHAIPPGAEFRPTVRPPRLGGNTRVGVFASRSLFRPNPIGLSLVRLESILPDPTGVRLKVSGLDLVDGTPVLDIKPYLPYVESVPQASAGFARAAPGELDVHWSDEAAATCRTLEASRPGFRLLAEETLRQDPRPAYQSCTVRGYAMLLDGITIHFSSHPGGLIITSLETADAQQSPEP